MYREPVVMGKKPGLRATVWTGRKEERNIQPEKNEETRIKKKMRRGLGTSMTSLNIPTPEL